MTQMRPQDGALLVGAVIVSSAITITLIWLAVRAIF